MGNKIATMRSISLPSVDKLKEFNSRYEDLSVVIGWVINLINTFAYVLDTPLRYPVKLLGSNSTIIDHIKVLDENRTFSREFPLHLKSAKCSRTEWDRFLYGIILLNKNLAQLRWQCGKLTPDMRPLLQNVADLMALGKDSFTIQEIVNALPRIRSLTLPPRSKTAHPMPINSDNGVDVPIVSRHLNIESKNPVSDGVGAKHETQNHLQSQISQSTSPNEKTNDITKVASEANLDLMKLNINDEDDVSNTKNTRSLSNSSSSSYDTIETDKLSDDITDTSTHKEDTITDPPDSQNILNIVRSVTKEGNNDVIATEKVNDVMAINSRLEITECEKSEHLKEENLNTLFWGDVTSRASALSKPSSFQRQRKNH